MKSYFASFFGNISRYAILGALLFVPVFAIPNIPVGFLYTKVGLLLILVSISFIAYLIKLICKQSIYIPSLAFTGLVKLLAIAGILSASFSVIPQLSFMGSGIDLDTLFISILLSVAGYMAGLYIKDKKSVLQTAVLFMVISFFIALFHDLRFLFGSDFLSLGIFKMYSTNLLGSFSDLSLYASVALLITVLFAEAAPISRLFRGILYFGGGLLIWLIIITNFNVVAGISSLHFSIPLSAVTSLFLAVIGSYTLRLNKRIPYFSATLAILLILVSTWSTQIATYTAKHAEMTPQETLDIRVSPSASLAVIRGAYSESIKSVLLGSGQGTYFSLWAKYKITDFPNSVNITPFWNYDFNSSFSYVSTILATNGLVGFTLWLLIICFVFYIMAKKIRDEDFWSLVFGIPAGYLLVVTCLYTPGFSIMTLVFIFTGISFAQFSDSTHANKYFKSYTLSYDNKKTAAVVLMNTLLVFSMLIPFYTAGNWILKVIASYRADQGLRFAQTGKENIDKAEQAVFSAISINPVNTYLRFFSELTLLRPGQIVSSGNIGSNSNQDIQIASADLTKSIQAAETAAYSNGISNDYRDWIQLGKVYEVATFLGSTTTAPLTIRAYARAENLAPKNPIPPYLVARIFYYAGQNEEALKKVRDSLFLKPDYEPALGLFKVLTSTSTASRVKAQLNSTVENTKKSQ